jgi:hypothetical protein
MEPSLDYSIPTSKDSQINFKREVRLQSPAAVHSSTQNSTIRFHLTSSHNFLDPETLAVYATVTYTGGGATLNAANVANAHIPNTAQMCSSFRLMSGSGKILEEIRDVGMYYTLMSDVSSSAEYQDRNADLTMNGHSEPYSRSAEPLVYRISCLDVSGLLHCGKLLHLQSLGGGLVVEIELAPDANVFGVRNAGHNPSYALTNVHCRYTEVSPSDAVRARYMDDVMGNPSGYAVVFDTCSTLTATIQSAIETIALPKKALKVKSLMSIVRTSADLVDKQKWLYARESASFKSFYYTIGGTQHPQNPVNSFAKAYEEGLKVGGNLKNCNHSGLSRAQWTTNIAAIHATSRDTDTTNGRFYMAQDLELSSGALSGVSMSGAGSDSLSIDFTGLTVPAVVTTFVVHSRVLSISQSGVETYD